MSSENIYSLIKFEEYSVTPKYIQLTNSILKGIEEGKIEKDYILPSINDLSYELEISRNTGEKAYKHLKNMGVVSSVPGKGYFVSKTEFKQSLKIFLLFNKLSPHKKIIYDSFVSALGDEASIDFFIYNNDFTLFRKLIQSRKEDYTHHVIIPHFVEGGEKAHEIINEIPGKKLILLDKLIPGIHCEHGAVYENFEKDIFESLKEALPQLSKYRNLKIIFPSYSYYPAEIIKGFQNFCETYAFDHKVITDIASESIKEGEVYINIVEDDLVVLLEKIQGADLKVGKNVGLISYNETPWKKFILDGLTTISTDFKKMGEIAAQMILTKDQKHIEVPFVLKLRNSL